MASTSSRKKMATNGSERDWTALPQGPLSVISEHLQSEIDVVRFRSVCSSWRSAAPRPQSRLFVKFDSSDKTLSLLTLSGAQITDPFEIGSRFGANSYCCGSSHGWVALFSSGQPVALFNPFTRAQIDLPAVTGLLKPCDSRLVLSSNPATTSDYTAVILTKGALERRKPAPALNRSMMRMVWEVAIYSSGEKAWSVTKIPSPWYKLHKFARLGGFLVMDVAFYRGLIYIAGMNRIFVFDPAADGTKFGRSIPLPCVGGKSWGCSRDMLDKSCGCELLSPNLVESCGDLLLVRSHDEGCYVFKLQFCGGRLQGAVRMESLGDRALFLGWGCSFSLSASRFPEYRGNHIYFRGRGRRNISVLSLADGKEEKASLVKLKCEWQRNFLWFRPGMLSQQT